MKKIENKWIRIGAMVLIGIVLVLIQYLISGRASGVVTGGILHFVWTWLGGKW